MIDVEETLTQRKEQKDEIVARRVAELLGEQTGLVWERRLSLQYFPAGEIGLIGGSQVC